MAEIITDHWDELQSAMGQGWPHYKNIAKPLFSTTSNEISNENEPERLLDKPACKRICPRWQYFIAGVFLVQLYRR